MKEYRKNHPEDAARTDSDILEREWKFWEDGPILILKGAKGKPIYNYKEFLRQLPTFVDWIHNKRVVNLKVGMHDATEIPNILLNEKNKPILFRPSHFGGFGGSNPYRWLLYCTIKNLKLSETDAKDLKKRLLWELKKKGIPVLKEFEPDYRYEKEYPQMLNDFAKKHPNIPQSAIDFIQKSIPTGIHPELGLEFFVRKMMKNSDLADEIMSEDLYQATKKLFYKGMSWHDAYLKAKKEIKL